MTDRFIENRIENSSSSVTALPDICHVFMDFVGVSLGDKMKKEKRKEKRGLYCTCCTWHLVHHVCNTVVPFLVFYLIFCN